MSGLVPSTEIERIVGADRHPTEHVGRAVEAVDLAEDLERVLSGPEGANHG